MFETIIGLLSFPKTRQNRSKVRTKASREVKLKLELLENRLAPAVIAEPADVFVDAQPLADKAVLPGDQVILGSYKVTSAERLKFTGANFVSGDRTTEDLDLSALDKAMLVWDINRNGKFDRRDRVLGKAFAVDDELTFKVKAGTLIGGKNRTDTFFLIGNLKQDATGDISVDPTDFFFKSKRNKAIPLDYVWMDGPESPLYTLPSAPSSTTGNLSIIKDSTPIRQQYLLGGELSPPVLRISLHADGEDIDVTKLAFATVGGEGKSIDRIELYRPGELTPFASAVAGTGSDHVPTTYQGNPTTVFTARMLSHQLVVPKDTNVVVYLKVFLKTDEQGALSGENIQLALLGNPSVVDPSTGEGSVYAVGVTSHNLLGANNGNAIKEGEIFVGNDFTGASTDIVGTLQTAVLSQIKTITNGNPDVNGTNVPTGVSPFGQFQVTAATNVNSRDGLNKVNVTHLEFVVNATNVLLDGGAFYLYDKGNTGVKLKGIATNAASVPLVGNPTGTFWVVFDLTPDFVLSFSSGETKTLVLEGSILNAQISSIASSTLQSGFDTVFFGWQDKDFGSTHSFLGNRMPDTYAYSTTYQS